MSVWILTSQDRSDFFSDSDTVTVDKGNLLDVNASLHAGILDATQNYPKLLMELPPILLQLYCSQLRLSRCLILTTSKNKNKVSRET